MIEINNLENNNGLLQLKLGTARIIKGHNNIIHIVDTNQYLNSIENILNTLDTFNHSSYTNSISTTRLKATELLDKIHNLIPHRTKRGLINGLGTAIKFITGNLDATDAEDINRQIDQIRKQDNHITQFLQDTNSLNTQMINRLNNLTKHINTQQDNIKKYINDNSQRLNNRIQKEEDRIQEIQYINQINYNLDILRNHVTDISETIILARLNIISKTILSNREIEIINKYVKNQSIHISSNEQLYELLKLQAYYNNTNIIFNIKIPIVENKNYELTQIIPLPINLTTFINVKPYMLIDQNNIFYMNTNCPQIENIYFCEDIIEQENILESSCMGQILNNKTARCHFKDKGHISSISQPKQNLLLFINVPLTQVHTSCKKQPFTINGTILIKFNNCTINVNGMNYESQSITFQDEMHIILPTYNPIHPKSITEELSLQKLKEYHFDNKIKLSSLQENTRVSNNITLLTISTMNIILIIIIIITLCTSSIIKHNYTLESDIAPANIPSLWPSLHSKGGGVTYPDMYPKP